MSKHISPTDTAKLIRADLKAAFPGVKFSVRTSKYAGGASINVDWTDGPSQERVEGVAKRYAGASFDGMTDMKTYHSALVAITPGELPEEVHYGADYVFCSRTASEDARAAARAILEAQVGPLNPREYHVAGVEVEGVYVRGGSVEWVLSRITEILAEKTSGV